jgi:pyruvate/2-oxoglutarate dehydrogenase complex dihydrolipoamide dehydrogenase (E3) component
MILNISGDKILGGSVVAPNAGEIFQELVLAKSAGLKMKDIFSKIYAYPVASRVNKAIVAKLFGGKLTRFSKRVLRFFY